MLLFCTFRKESPRVCLRKVGSALPSAVGEKTKYVIAKIRAQLAPMWKGILSHIAYCNSPLISLLASTLLLSVSSLHCNKQSSPVEHHEMV